MTGKKVLEAGLYIASTDTLVHRCLAIRLVRGVHKLMPLSHMTTAEVWHWQSHTRDDPSMFYPEGDDLDRPVDLKALISEDYAVREGNVTWQD